MTASIRDLQNDLLARLDEALAASGFRLRARSQTLLRNFEAGREAVHVSFIRHVANFDLTVDVAIRFDRVEDLVNRSHELPSAREKRQTFTLGAELGNVTVGRPLRWVIRGTDSVAPAVAGILGELSQHGLPYFERFTNMDNAYQMLARDDRDAWLHSPIHLERAKRACALLVVMNRCDELPLLVERKAVHLASIPGTNVEKFRKFASELIDAGAG